MSSNLPRLAVRQATKIKANNPYMSTRSIEESAQNEQVAPATPQPNASTPEPVPVQKEDFSIAKFFRMRSLDQALIRNVRRLIEEERDRQMDFERMHHSNLNY